MANDAVINRISELEKQVHAILELVTQMHTDLYAHMGVDYEDDSTGTNSR